MTCGKCSIDLLETHKPIDTVFCNEALTVQDIPLLHLPSLRRRNRTRPGLVERCAAEDAIAARDHGQNGVNHQSDQN